MQSGMQSFLVHLKQEQYSTLRKLSTETGIPMARMIRQSVDNWLGSGVVSSGQSFSGHMVLVTR